MALLDVFKPKWQRSNPRSRIAGIHSLNDQSVLASLADNDPDASVRDAAVKRLDALRPKWQHSQVEVRRQAITKLRDQKALKELAKSDPDESVRQLAAERIEQVRADLRAKARKRFRDTLNGNAQTDEDWEKIVRLCRSLKSELAEELTACLADSAAPIRARERSARLLGQFGVSSAIPTLVDALEEASAAHRKEKVYLRRLISVLDRLECEDARVASPLRSVWSDKEVRIIPESVRLLARTTAGDCIDEFKQALSSLDTRLLASATYSDRVRSNIGLVCEAGKELSRLAEEDPDIAVKLRAEIDTVLDSLVRDAKESVDSSMADFGPSTPHIAHFRTLARSRIKTIQQLQREATNPVGALKMEVALACIDSDPTPHLRSVLDAMGSEDSGSSGGGLFDALAYMSAHSAQSLEGQGTYALIRIGEREKVALKALGKNERYRELVQDIFNEMQRWPVHDDTFPSDRIAKPYD